MNRAKSPNLLQRTWRGTWNPWCFFMVHVFWMNQGDFQQELQYLPADHLCGSKRDAIVSTNRSLAKLWSLFCEIFYHLGGLWAGNLCWMPRATVFFREVVVCKTGHFHDINVSIDFGKFVSSLNRPLVHWKLIFSIGWYCISCCFLCCNLAVVCWAITVCCIWRYTHLRLKEGDSSNQSVVLITFVLSGLPALFRRMFDLEGHKLTPAQCLGIGKFYLSHRLHWPEIFT